MGRKGLYLARLGHNRTRLKLNIRRLVLNRTRKGLNTGSVYLNMGWYLHEEVWNFSYGVKVVLNRGMSTYKLAFQGGNEAL